MGVIPEDDEERWGTGKYEDLTLTQNDRPDLDEMEGYEEDDLQRASLP